VAVVDRLPRDELGVLELDEGVWRTRSQLELAVVEYVGWPDTPLKLLEISQAVKAAEGTTLELTDCAFTLLASVDIYDDPVQAFDGVNIALLVGARPRFEGHGARRPAAGGVLLGRR
jgi:malate dehydrogenase